MAAANVRSNTLQLQPNVPVELVLKYQTGRVIQSTGNVLFTMIDNMSLFLRPDDAHKVHALGLRQNEPFRIVKRVEGRSTQIIVTRVNSQQPREDAQTNVLSAATSMASSTCNSPSGQPSQVQNNSLSGIMARSYISAIDALIVAKQYADTKGMSLRITEEEIRASAHCIFIEVSKIKERTLRYGGAR